MLKPKQQREEYRQLVVKSKEWRSLPFPSHKRDIGREKEGVVIVAHEAIFGEECLLEALDSLCKSPF